MLSIHIILLTYFVIMVINVTNGDNQVLSQLKLFRKKSYFISDTWVLILKYQFMHICMVWYITLVIHNTPLYYAGQCSYSVSVWTESVDAKHVAERHD